MTAAAVGATAAGVGVLVWLKGWSWWPVVAGWWVGIIMRDPAAMLAGLGGGVGAVLYLEANGLERARDQDEQGALLFLVRLKQLLSVKGTLAGALDEMGYRSLSSNGDAAERVVIQIAEHYRVGALLFLSRVSTVVRRHGGSLAPLVDWAVDTIQDNQSRRSARQLEEAAQRTTILVLAFAPWGVVGVFRLMVPSFYRIVVQTTIGSATVILVGAITLSVFLVLATHMKKGAAVR